MEKISIRQAKTAISGLRELIEWIKTNGDKPIKEMNMVEIGSFVGDSTREFAEAGFNSIICVDPFLNGYDETDASSETWPMERIYKQFKEDILDVYKNVNHFRMTSEAASKLFRDEDFDFVYIDGNHLYEFVKLDLVCWLPKIKRPGWIGGHDYQHKRTPGVKPAVLEILGQIDHHFPETSWIRRLS